MQLKRQSSKLVKKDAQQEKKGEFENNIQSEIKIKELLKANYQPTGGLGGGSELWCRWDLVCSNILFQDEFTLKINNNISHIV